jgi:tellurite resistance protein TerC
MTVLIFIVLAVVPLWLDIRSRHQDQGLADAVWWSLLYIFSALLFAGYLAITQGAADASLFLTGYVLEKTLSVDNLIVMGATLAYFGISGRDQHRALHWGIVGAVVLRLVFVMAGIGMFFIFGRLLQVVFGLFIAWTAVKVLGAGDAPTIQHETRWYTRAAKRFFPESTHLATLVMCIVAIEFTDITFAFDSVPAVLAVTRDPLLAYSSIMFAVLGLRALYFVLESLKRYLTHLSKAVVAVLFFIAAKLLLGGLFDWDLSPVVSLCVVLAFLGAGVAASLVDRPTVKGASR